MEAPVLHLESVTALLDFRVVAVKEEYVRNLVRIGESAFKRTLASAKLDSMDLVVSSVNVLCPASMEESVVE